MSNTFANFQLDLNPGMAEAFDGCRAVATADHWCALLCGSFGNGKTHLAIAALNEFIDRNRPRGLAGWFWKVPDFIAMVRRVQFAKEGPGVDEVLAGYQNGAGLIVFDDLGAENQTDYAAEQLYRVLDARYDSGLPTLITSNRQPDLLDGRIVSRFRSGLVICRGRDLR